MADVPAAAAGSAPAPQKLDELMMAMDVVDTLRHQEGLAEKELAADDRDAALKARLRSLYEGQGLAVSDRILEEGIRALKESRFTYVPPPPGFGVTLARLWIARGRVTVVALVLAVLIAGGVGVASWRRAAALEAETAARVELTETLPKAIDASLAAALAEAKVDAAANRAKAVAAEARAALARGAPGDARAAIGRLEDLRRALADEYVLKIVSRPGATTGFDRIPEVNPTARNYYVVVEAVRSDGSLVALPITSEEDGTTKTVTTWGVRVPKRVFDAVRRDKSDDGIVENDVLGEKPRGALDVVYAMTVDGGAITSW